MKFEKDNDGTIFAFQNQVVFNGNWYEELIWAEIDTRLPMPIVRFESDYYNPKSFNTLEEAKNHIVRFYKNYTPQSNGTSHPIEDVE